MVKFFLFFWNLVVDTCANGPKESLVDSRWYLVSGIRKTEFIILATAFTD